MASNYIPLVSWETKIDTPLPVIGEPYHYTCKVASVNPNDYSPNELGELGSDLNPKTDQFYIVDYLGKIYKIVKVINAVTGEVKIYDLIEDEYEGPYVDQNAYVYQARSGKNVLTQAQRKRLHPSAFDMIWNIENNVLNFLNDLSDVNLSSESKFDVLMYNESSWENSSYYYDLHNRTDGAFRLYGGVITENLDGTVDVTAGKGMVHTLDGVIEGAAVDANSHWISPMIEVEWDAVSGLILTDHAYNYIYYDYETGTIQATTDFYSISFHREFTVGRVYRTGTDVVARICGTNAWAFDKRVQLFGEERFPVERAKGMMIGNPSGLYISVTEGVLWAELVNRFTVEAFDSSGTDTFSYWYRDGLGAWTKVATQSVIDNTNWDDGTGTLNDLTANRYGVHWVYEVHDSSIHVVYGRGDYTLSNAQEATPPNTIPGLLSSYATLIGKIIVQKSSATLYSVESPFVVRFGGTAGVTSHLDLTDIGTNTHAQIDTHIADTTLHFTEASIDHTNILNIGTNTHAQIDSHIADSSIHFSDLSGFDTDDLTQGSTNLYSQWDIATGGINYSRGNVGIGTSIPITPLHAKSSGYIQTWETSSNPVTNRNRLALYGNNGNFRFIRLNDGSSILYGAEILSMDLVNERIGIRDSTPSYTLDVNGTGRYTNKLYLGTTTAPATDTGTLNALVWDNTTGEVKQRAISGGGTTITFGSENEIPVTNSTTDGFDYDSDFKWNERNLLINYGIGNILIGENAGRVMPSIEGNSYNVIVGNDAAYSANSSLNLSVMIGYKAGYSGTGLSQNVFLGTYAGYYETGSNKLFIDNQSRTNEATARTSSLIYGEFNATPASQLLRVNGDLNVSYKLDHDGDYAGFLGATPVTKQAVTPGPNGLTAGSTYGTNEQAIINALNASFGELWTAMEKFGFIYSPA